MKIVSNKQLMEWMEHGISEIGDQSCDELTAIARKYLDIGTLEARRSDSLDFHEVAVWRLKEALQAAYDLGVHNEGEQNARDAAGASL